ncbi:MAG: hypothetical protein P1P88_04995 [Bacteroidales bacterium]|nr:hypothetical protein [Bacteroidales bacterium]
MKIKYILFIIIWIAEFYALFSLQNDSVKIYNWDLMSRFHFSFYGVIVGTVLVAFWYVNDNFNPNKK